MKRLGLGAIGLTALVIAAAAETPPQQSSNVSALLNVFLDAVKGVGIIFSQVGNLSGGVSSGQVWLTDLRTGEHRQVSEAGDLAWPVMATDGQTVFALRGRQLVRFGLTGQAEAAIGDGADWRKLIGVRADDTVLAFVVGTPRAHPAMMTAQGKLQLLPQPESDDERLRMSRLLEENRAYSTGEVLRVQRSSREGGGLDVFLEIPGAKQTMNISNCGNDLCGQPSLSPDGQSVLYVRAAQR